jgi:hypothetical protein
MLVETKMSLPQAHTLFRKYFPGLRLNDFMDPTITWISKTPKIDLCKLDDFLHEKHGNYESRKLSMSQLLEKEYGKDAKTFIENLI